MKIGTMCVSPTERKLDMSLNKIIVCGRCGGDPELRMTGTGTPVCSVTLAVDRDFSGKDGQKETDWIPVVAWRNTATFMSNYFSKGRMMIASGSLQMRKWKDKDGNNRVSAEIVADNVYFADSKRDGGNFDVLDNDEALPFDEEMPF